ncbi:hypothetical protein CYMTET_46352 [Cymbomonas tetramitiformis]|uniref:ABC transmembrane type-1 domain-containing protein n=1 Tax=Cymbomonas tetramitiformis TaxID=36881 RepID=A0AAE0BWE8_9CHLO|nr:hypothetical protein CYMTET_46352 [Cymbomonas tetramitiformis]
MRAQDEVMWAQDELILHICGKQPYLMLANSQFNRYTDFSNDNTFNTTNQGMVLPVWAHGLFTFGDRVTGDDTSPPPVTLALSVDAAQVGIAALYLGHGKLNSMSTTFAMWALGARVQALSMWAEWEQNKNEKALTGSQENKGRINPVHVKLSKESRKYVDIEEGHILSQPDLISGLFGLEKGVKNYNVHALEEIGSSLIAFSFLELNQGARLCRVLKLPVPKLQGGENDEEKRLIFVAELSSRLRHGVGSSLEEIWAQWDDYRRGNRWRKGLSMAVAKDRQASASLRLEDESQENWKAMELPEISTTPLGALQWTINWWRSFEPASFKSAVLHVCAMAAWKLIEALIVQSIFDTAVSEDEKCRQEAEAESEFSGSCASIADLLEPQSLLEPGLLLPCAFLIVGNVLCTLAAGRIVFMCPSGGGFIPRTKVHVMKHLSMVPQWFLDTLSFQAILTTLDVDLKVIDANLDFVLQLGMSVFLMLSTILTLFILQPLFALGVIIIIPLVGASSAAALLSLRWCINSALRGALARGGGRPISSIPGVPSAFLSLYFHL